jgi:hypothetical protein
MEVWRLQEVGASATIFEKRDCLKKFRLIETVSKKDTLLSPWTIQLHREYCEGTRVADDLKLKGPVREIGVVRDSDRHDSFNITIGISIKTEGRVSYEEAERLSAKFRREYLGKDVEFVSVSIPCPVCGKIMNSESGLRKHVAMNHPDKVNLVNPPKVAAREKLDKNTRGKKVEKPIKTKEKRGKRTKKVMKTAKPVKAGRIVKAEKPKLDRAKSSAKIETPPDIKTGLRTELKPEPVLKTPKHPPRKQQTRGKQLTLA